MQLRSRVVICRGVPPWAPVVCNQIGKMRAPTEGRPYKLGHHQIRLRLAIGILLISSGSIVVAQDRQPADLDKAAGRTKSFVEQSRNQSSSAKMFEKLAASQLNAGDFAGAEESYLKALEINEAAFGPTHEAVADTLFLLAELYQFAGRHKEAEQSYQRLVSLREELPTNKIKLSEALDRFGCLMRKMKRNAHAEDLEARSFAVSSKSIGQNDVAPVEGEVLNGTALKLLKPSYPAEARRAGASGMVVVRVAINETGDVIRACAIEGHPMLTRSSEGSAFGSKFSPTKLNGTPVKVSGVITYNFVRQ